MIYLIDLVFLVFSVLVYLMVRKGIIPIMARANFPLNQISEYFGIDSSAVSFSTLEYSKTAFHQKKYLKDHFKLIPWMPNYYSYYYIFFYKIEINCQHYWLVFHKEQSSFGRRKNWRYLLYSSSLEFLKQLSKD